jgi:hypothetical protein
MTGPQWKPARRHIPLTFAAILSAKGKGTEMVNFAETQMRHNEGKQSLPECFRLGQTYAAYGWGSSNPTGNHAWDKAQWEAFKKGFNNGI